MGVISMLVLSLHNTLRVVFALLFMTTGSAGVAISDVTIDACAAENSINRPTIAADIQTLCGFSASIGALLGFSISGLLVHLMGSQVICHPAPYKIDHIFTSWSCIRSKKKKNKKIVVKYCVRWCPGQHSTEGAFHGYVGTEILYIKLKFWICCDAIWLVDCFKVSKCQSAAVFAH